MRADVRRIAATMIGTLLALAGPLVALACEGQPGTGPFTVVGWVTRPDGAPVAGLPVTLVPLAPGGEPDLENGVYRIEERDSHLVRTNEDGLFVMPQVFDYPEVTTHRYQVMPAWLAGLEVEPPAQGERGVWLEDGLLDLTDLEAGMVKLRLAAKPAGSVRIELGVRGGIPFNGTRALLLAGEGPALVVTAQFENGTAELGNLPPGQLKLGLLDGELGYFVQQRAAYERRPLTDYLLTSGGTPLVPVIVNPGQTTAVSLSLP